MTKEICLVKTKQRVADHGEVFTPPWMVEAMLDTVKDETERIDARFLEPACGSGNFIRQILQRKLVAVEQKYGKAAFNRKYFALLSLMCIYGVEILADNVTECRANALQIFSQYTQVDEDDDLYDSASQVLMTNILHGNALSMQTNTGDPIVFASWGPLSKGKYQRRDFRLDVLMGSSAYSLNDYIFAHRGKHELFTPVKTYSPMTVHDLAKEWRSRQPSNV